MKKHFLLISAIVLSLVLVSCASSRNAEEEVHLNKVYVTNTTKVPLLPVSAIKEELDLFQIFEGKFGHKSFPNTMLNLQSNSEGIVILMLNDLGIEIGSIEYNGKSCVMNSSFFPKNLKAEYIVLDLQNAYADAEELKAHYKKHNLDFDETSAMVNGQEAKIRTICKDGNIIEQIVLQNSNVEIKNKLRDYTYYLSFVQ